MGDAVIEMNIARRNVSIYPPGHPSIAASVRRALEKLNELFALQETVTLAVTGDVVVAGDAELDRKNAVFRDFSSHLHGLGISLVTLKKGLTEDELLTFCERVLARSKREGPLRREEIEEITGGIPHISIELVDYSIFRVEEGEAAEGETGEKLWERYIFGLLSGTLAPEDAEPVISVIPPGVLASLLNQVSGEGKAGEEGYEKVISAYLKRSSRRRYAPEDIRRLLDLVDSLRPELKRQFLSLSLRGRDVAPEELSEAFEGLSVDEVERFLTLIETQQVSLPETLKNLLETFSRTDEALTGVALASEGILLDDLLLRDDMLSIFEKGKFEDFVTEEYQEEIRKILSHAPDSGGGSSVVIVEEEVERDGVEVLMELLSAGVLDPEEEGRLKKVLLERSRGLLAAGDLEGLLESLSFFASSGGEEKGEGIPEEIRGDDSFLDDLAAALRFVGRREREAASQIVRLVGVPLLPRLLDALADEEDGAVRKFLIDVISLLGRDAARAALERVRDSRWFVTRNMLHIVSLAGGDEERKEVFPFLTHPDVRVRAEAFRCLLSVRDAEAVRLLLKSLEAPGDAFFPLAVELAGRFRVVEAVGPLCSFLLKPPRGPGEVEERKRVVLALAEIGDPSCLEAFRKVLKGKSLLFRGALESLKETIYRSLAPFPLHLVRDLLEEGAEKGGEETRRICRRILRKKEGGE
ncbi:MAG: hypothetical protein D6713_07950 [Deltaproteobacteria bacterium]|nr:MAG: hypothetical protein D6713_07950 [Deltaproteobacteria bacterium]